MMSKIKWILVVSGVLHFFNTQLIAQNIKAEEKGSPSLIIKYSPVSVLDFYNPSLLQVGVEHRLSGKHFLEHEAGLISAYRIENNFNGNVQGTTKIGWRLQEEWRIYFNEGLRADKGNGYFSLMATWRYSSYEDWVTVSSSDWNFFRTYQTKVEDELLALSPGLGMQMIWDNLLTVDFSANLGISYKRRSNGTPEDSNFIFFDDGWGDFPDAFTLRSPTERIAPHLTISVKLGFIAGRRE